MLWQCKNILHTFRIALLCTVLALPRLSVCLETEKLEWIGETRVLAPLIDVASGDQTAYCATRYGVYEISLDDPSNPRIVSRIPTPGEAYQLVVEGDYIYVADGTGGLAVLEITEQGQLEYVNNIDVDLGQNYTEIKYAGERLFVYNDNPDAGNDGKIVYFNLDDPAEPEYEDHIRCRELMADWTTEDDLLITRSAGAYTIWQFIAFEGLVEVGELDTDRAPGEILVRDSFIYYAMGFNRNNNEDICFKVYHIDDPADPELMSQLEVERFTDEPHLVLFESFDMRDARENFAYIMNNSTDDEARNMILNIENLNEPEIVGYFGEDILKRTANLHYADGEDYLVGVDPVRQSTLRVFDVSDLEEPDLAGSLDVDYGKISDVEIYNDGVYFRDGNRLYSLDKNNWNNVNEIYFLRDATNREKIRVIPSVDKLVLLYETESLHVLALDDPLSPELVSEFDTGLENGIFDVENTLLSLAGETEDRNTEFQLYNLEGDEQITQISTLNLEGTGETFSIDLDGDKVYLTCESENEDDGRRYQYVYLISIADPEELELIDRRLYSLVHNRHHFRVKDDILLRPTTLYHPDPPWGRIAGYGLKFYDMTDFDNPDTLGQVVVSTKSPPVISEITGSVAYLSCSYDGIKIVSFFDPENPELLGKAETPYRSYNVDVEDNFVVVADYYSLQMFDVSEAVTADFVELDADSIVFETTAVGDTSRSYLIITNISDRKRTITDVTFPEEYIDNFSSDFTEAVVLEPDAEHGITLYFHPSDEAYFNDEFRVFINDLALSVKLYANTPAYGVPVDKVELPRFELRSVYPNPFNNMTKVEFILPRASAVSFSVYSLKGGLVYQSNSNEFNVGMNLFTLDLSSFTSGIYFLKVDAGDIFATRKLILLN